MEFKSTFEIIIDFNKDAKNPSRIFKCMASIIDAFEDLDMKLSKNIHNKIDTVLVIEDIEKGSLKTVLRNIISAIPDEALQSLDIKQLIGHYLVKAKYIIIRKLDGKIELTDGGIIQDIEYEIIEEADKLGISKLPYYEPINQKMIIEGINNITNSLEVLTEGDSVIYSEGGNKANFNLSLKIDKQYFEDLITKETLSSTSRMILKVKKPDYLGDSMWSFKHGSLSVSAKIDDTEWLNKFQSGEIELRPQDSMVCDVSITVKYDNENEVISITHTITKVHKINSHKKGNNTKELDFDSNPV